MQNLVNCLSLKWGKILEKHVAHSRFKFVRDNNLL